MALFSCKNLSFLLRGITSKHNSDFYCVNCLHSFRTENKFKVQKNVCKNHDYCYREMSEEGKNILKYNHVEKFHLLYMPLLGKTDTCHNNPEKSSSTKVNTHTGCGHPLFTQCSFDSNRNKHDY